MYYTNTNIVKVTLFRKSELTSKVRIIFTGPKFESYCVVFGIERLIEFGFFEYIPDNVFNVVVQKETV